MEDFHPVRLSKTNVQSGILDFTNLMTDNAIAGLLELAEMKMAIHDRTMRRLRLLSENIKACISPIFV
jgi:hypothetical protein